MRVLGDVGSTPSETVRFLACAPNTLSRAQAGRDVDAARITDPSVVWDGAIGGADGDRGALQHLGDALAAGDASRAHLDVAVRCLSRIPTTIRRGTTTLTNTDTGEVVEQRNAELLDAHVTRDARRHCPQVAAHLARELVLTVDPQHEDRAFHDPDAFARRGLVFGPPVGGVVRMTVDLDETATVVLRQALAAEAAPLPAHVRPDGELVRDLRSKRQRDHDALLSLTQRGAAAGGPAVAEAARVSVVATAADVAAATEQRAAQTGAVVEGHGPVATATLGYLVCGALLQKVLTGAGGAVLDLGRATRLATASQRRALAVRDGGCVAPGCAVAPWACEAHHAPAWEDGGRTDLDTMVLLCPGHHRAWHAHHLEVRLRPDRTVEARWIHRDPRWPGHAAPQPWVHNSYPADRRAARELGARLRTGGDEGPGADPPG
nr:HNH endonuclease signature motif containing protein [Kineococcus siccus]